MHKTKATYVFPSGSPKTAKYIIVGTAPDRQDVLKNRPFSGIDGSELEDDLHKAGINKNDCYFTYVIKDADRPPGYYISMTMKGITIKPEGQKYVNLLTTELAECTATTIISLGSIPLFVLADRTRPDLWRGSVIQPTLLGGKTLIPTVDPLTVNFHYDRFTRKPKGGQYLNKRLIISDLIRASKVADGLWKPLDRNIIIRPSFKQCDQFFKACEMYGFLGNIIYYDIEIDVFNGEMTCISFAYSPTDVISIPFTYERGDYFTIDQEILILKRIARILEHPDIMIGGQNLVFDTHYMLRKYGISIENVVDTMAAQKTLLPDYKVGLGFICTMYTDLPYYKDDGKYWLKGIGTFDMGWKYNALDSIVCADAHPKQVAALIRSGNYYTYLRKIKTLPAYVYIMEHGILIDLDSMKKEYDKLQDEASDTLLELERIAGQTLNPNSPKQIATYFYTTKNLPMYKSKSGAGATDEKALKRISRKGFKEAKLILHYRHLIKTSATFLDPKKVDTDGRMRCSYNPVGTRFARASSSESIFGTGNNLQNQPHTVLAHYRADPYYVYYGGDYSQAENRIVAYVGRISQMIEAFENKIDIHGRTAKIMMSVFYGPERAATMDVHDPAPIGDGTKIWRDWGKKANHGLNYDLGYKSFALRNEIPEKDGKLIVDIYHTAYPGVRKGFHAYVKSCINRTRSLKNLMGRTTKFTDKLDDNLYKDAYACIPQGTVGDAIDDRGLNFIYYNTNPLFQYVELMIQVHDSVGFQVPTPYHPTHPVAWEDHVKILNMIKASMEQPLFTHYKHKFSLPVDWLMGISLCKDNGFDLDEITPQSLNDTYWKLEQDFNRTYITKETL